MAGTQRIIGYKPATNPVGWGWTSAATMRGTSFPGRNKGYWIARIGSRVGKYTSSATTLRYAAYEANKNTLNPEDRIGNTAAFTVNTRMTDRVSGATFEHNVTSPIPVAASQPITLSTLGTGQAWAHGQDHSGSLMYERGSLGSFPNTFGSTNTRPEGAMSLWAVAYEDAAPTIPLATVSPGSGHSTTDETPTISFDFRSTNEELPGFSIGQADKISKYQVQVWNSAKTSKLRDSTVQNADGTMQTNRRVAWTVASALSPGQYTLRAQVYNQFGTKSAWREWTINIVGAGSISVTDPTGTTNDTTPDIWWDYSHKQSLAMDKIRVRIMDGSETTVVRPDFEYDFPVDPLAGVTGVMFYTDTSWPALTTGNDYTAFAQAIDTDGQPSPWSAGHAFHVNAAPSAPNYRQPLPGTVTTVIPELSALASDMDDETSTLTTVFEISKQGSGSTDTLAGSFNASTNRWFCQPMQNNIIPPGDYGIWEWRVQASDPHGATGPWSTWLSFEYAAPPVITITNPTGTISVANPTFTWSVDRAQTAYRIRLFNTVAGDPILNGDSGWVTSAVGSHTFDKLLLRHNADVRAVIDVITTGDVPGSHEWNFDVAYTPPATVTGVTATTVVAAYDYPGTATSIEVAWNKVATNPEDFGDYLIRRVDTVTGESEDLVVLSDIDQTSWTDDSAPAGSTVEYQVMQRVWNALDIIPSVPASDTASIDRIVGLVVTPVIGGGAGVVLPFWEYVTVTPTIEVIARKSWARKPRISAAPQDHRVITGTAIMQADALQRWDADDMRQKLTTLALPYVDEDGYTRARTLCVRFWDGRVVLGTVTHISETGDNNIRRRDIDIEITESNFERGRVT